jgi:agmatine/peptidylarginine deiminase
MLMFENTVVVASALAARYPQTYWPMRINLEAVGVDFRTINSQNVWCRDYFPVMNTAGKLIGFEYDKYGGEYPQLDVSNRPWEKVFGNAPIIDSGMVLDGGGNLVQAKGVAVITHRVITDNDINVIGKLEKLLDAQIIIIPMEPGDDLGHSDGIVKFIDSKNILMNDYSQWAKREKKMGIYEEKVERILSDAGLNVFKFPNAYDAWDWNMTEEQFRRTFPDGDDFNPGFGYYINFLRIANQIILPSMKIDRDQEAFEAARKYFPRYRIVMVDCAALSMAGGLINCVTWSA